jgi:hypothetical protein
MQPPVALQKQVLEIQQAAKVVSIRNADDYRVAAEMSRGISALRKEVDATFDPIIAKAHEAHKEALAQKKRFSLPLEMDQRAIDSKLMAWTRAQEDIRRQQERELQAKLKKEADDLALAEAEKLARAGDVELADAVLEQQAAAPEPVVSLPKVTPKVEGFASRVVWRYRIENAALIPREYLMPDEIKIGQVVRALKGATNIPGVKAFSEDSAIHRG